MTPVEAQTIRNQILNQISCPVGTIELVAGYRLKLMLAAIITFIAVLLYAALILATICFAIMAAWAGAYGMSTAAIHSGRARGFGYLLFVLGPLFVGFCVVVALLKPLLIPAAADELEGELELSPKTEPFLFEFVARLCKSLKAPMPAVIAVNSDVNASASFIRGPLDGRMKLTLGLPLILGMDVQQVAGILAHEFGHFSQRGGMFMTTLIWNINQWFYRAAFERDQWDQWLAESSKSLDSWLAIILLLARGFVWLVRIVPILLLLLCKVFCAGLMQEMEFDADRYEARVAGSHKFAKTVRRIQKLAFGQAGSIEDLGRFHAEGRLPDNLCQLAVANVDLLPPEIIRNIEEQIRTGETGRFDTHPADRERIANAERENAPGTLRLECPAEILFRDATALGRHLTFKIYLNIFGKEFDPKKVLATGGLVQQLVVENEDRKASENFLLCQFQMHRSFILPRENLGTKIDQAVWKQDTENCRKRLLGTAMEFALCRKQAGELRDSMVDLISARVLLDVGCQLESLQGNFAATTVDEIRRKLVEYNRREAEFSKQQEPFRRLLGTRLMNNLEWIRSAKIREKIAQSDKLVQEIGELLACWCNISRHQLLLERFAFEYLVGYRVLQHLSTNESEESLKGFNKQAEQIGYFLGKIRREFEAIPYPFEHGDGKVSLGYYVLPDVPNGKAPFEILEAATGLQSGIVGTMQRIAWRLTSIACKIEQEMGFPLLVLPNGLAELSESLSSQSEED